MKKVEVPVAVAVKTVEQEEVLMDEYGCIIKPLKDLITTEQPEAATAEETED